MNDISLKIKIDKLKVDFKKVNRIEEEISIREYTTGNELKLIDALSDLINKYYEDYDDIECNIENIITFNKEVLFKNLDISFKADTYTTIIVIFSGGDSIELNGETGDYYKHAYSFNKLNDKLKYRNRVVEEIRAFGSFGSEEFNSITINFK